MTPIPRILPQGPANLATGNIGNLHGDNESAEKTPHFLPLAFPVAEVHSIWRDSC